MYLNYKCLYKWRILIELFFACLPELKYLKYKVYVQAPITQTLNGI